MCMRFKHIAVLMPHDRSVEGFHLAGNRPSRGPLACTSELRDHRSDALLEDEQTSFDVAVLQGIRICYDKQNTDVRAIGLF